MTGGGGGAAPRRSRAAAWGRGLIKEMVRAAWERADPTGVAAARASLQRLRPNRSCASTHSSATTAEPSESSPQSTVAATISANLRTLPFP